LYEIRYLDILSKLDNEQYLEYIKKIELKYGNEPSFQLMMIDVYINQQEWDKAIGSVNQVDSIINKDPFLDYYRGLISNMKGDEKKAAEYFENLVKNDPAFADVYPELIIIYAKDGQNEKAKKYYSAYKKMKAADKTLLEYFESNYPILQSK
jgi:tetratricopeptide (TPR) repeat protein